MKHYKTLLFLFFTSFSFSQIDFSEREKLSITISPLSLIDIIDGSSLRLGADVKLSKDFRFSFEAGTYYRAINMYKMKNEGFLIKPELKIRLFSTKYYHQYIGIEYQYKEQSYNLRDSISINQGENFEKEYHMKRKANCISLKYSRVEKLSNNFTFEYFAGFGVRFLRSSNDLTQAENDGILDDEFHGGTQVEYSIRPIGKINTGNIIAGVKFGYILF